MGGTALHAGILSRWFEMLLLLLLKIYSTMVLSGILFGIMTPIELVLGRIQYLYFANQSNDECHVFFNSIAKHL